MTWQLSTDMHTHVVLLCTNQWSRLCGYDNERDINSLLFVIIRCMLCYDVHLNPVCLSSYIGPEITFLEKLLCAQTFLHGNKKLSHLINGVMHLIIDKAQQTLR